MHFVKNPEKMYYRTAQENNEKSLKSMQRKTGEI